MGSDPIGSYHINEQLKLISAQLNLIQARLDLSPSAVKSPWLPLAKAAQARAGVVKTVADSELARAKTLETVSKIDMDQTRMAMDAVKMIGLPEQTPPRPEL